MCISLKLVVKNAQLIKWKNGFSKIYDWIQTKNNLCEKMRTVHYFKWKKRLTDEAIFSLWHHLRLSTKIALNLCQTVLCLWQTTFSLSLSSLPLISLWNTHFQSNFSFALKSRIKFVFLIFRSAVITRLNVGKIQQQQNSWKLTNCQTHNSKLCACTQTHTHTHRPLNRVGGNEFSSSFSFFRIK